MAAVRAPAPDHESVTFYYLATAASVAIARKAAERVARSWGFGNDKVETVCLVVSELVTNVVTNAPQSEVQVRLSPDFRGHVLVEVRDESPEMPKVKRVPPLSEDGRGLFIVQTLSVTCGVHWEDGRKVVYSVV